MATAPNLEALRATGGMVEGEHPPFPSDDSVPDHSTDILDAFGLSADAGNTPNAGESGTEGGASPSAATPAAEKPVVEAQPAPQQAPQQQPGGQGDPTQAPAPASQPAAPADQQQNGGPALDPAIQALQAQVSALIAQNAQLQQQMQQGTSPQQAPNTATGVPQEQVDPEIAALQTYNLAIPDEVAGYIFDEDPVKARQGLTHLINSLGRVVHERAIKHAERLVQQQLSQHTETQQISAEQQRMQDDYYSNFKDHNDPGIRIIVAQEAQRLWQEQPTLVWDETARNTLGARVNARLGRVTAQPQQQAAPEPQPAPRPAAQMGASTRSATGAGQSDGDFIIDVLSAQ